MIDIYPSQREVRDREDAFANTRDARATEIRRGAAHAALSGARLTG
jgi:hypothetical protein